jgi:hypothetical protein
MNRGKRVERRVLQQSGYQWFVNVSLKMRTVEMESLTAIEKRFSRTGPLRRLGEAG